MAGTNNTGMTGILTQTDLSAALSRLQEFLATPEMQAARSELLSTDRGAALLKMASGLYEETGNSIVQGYQNAVEELASLARQHGTPEELVQTLSDILMQAPKADSSLTDQRIAEWAENVKTVTGGENWRDTAEVFSATDSEKMVMAASTATQTPLADAAEYVGSLFSGDAAAAADITETLKQAGTSRLTEEGKNLGALFSSGATGAASDNTAFESLLQSVKDASASLASSKTATADTAASATKTTTKAVEVSGSTINSYLKQTASNPKLTKGNVTEMDYNILSELAYARKACDTEEYHIASEKDGLTVAEYCKELLLAAVETPEGITDRAAYLETLRNDPEALLKAETQLSDDNRGLLEGLMNNSRYSNLTIDHADGLDTGNINTQVIVVNLGGGHAIVAIQGTNGTTTDWINDAKFASDELTEEEVYINGLVQRYVREYDSFDITGHSQGGRDAVTAAAFLPDDLKDNLRYVYSLDGPGYSDAFLERYGELFESIENKVTNIRPENSYVGAIFNPIGEIKYVPTNDSGPLLHSGTTWRYAVDENGNPTGGFAEGNETTLTKCINAFTNYAMEKFSPAAVQETLPIVLRLLSDPNDPVTLEFSLGNIISNLDQLSVGDGLMLISMGATLISEGLMTAIDKVGPYISAAGKILTVLSCIPWPGAAVCGALAAVFNNINKVIKIIDTVCKVVSFVFKSYLEYKAKKLQQERADYIAGNAEIHVDYQALKNAQALLESASSALTRAMNAGDSMWDHFAQRRIDEKTNIIEDIIHTVYEVVTTFLSPAKALKWAVTNVSDALQDLTMLTSRPYLNKGASCITTVITAVNSVATSVGEYSTTNPYTVKPAALGAYAEEAQAYAQAITDTINDSQASINEAGSIWQADDYSSLKTINDQRVDEMLDRLSSIHNTYINVQNIATAYTAVQSTCVQEFQAAAN